MVGIGNTRSILSSVNNSNASNNTAAAAARLASGQRLTRASDDIAALAAGTALNSQVAGLRATQSNLLQANSLLQVANGGLNQQLDILQRQRALSTQASSGQLNDSARAALNQEFQGLSAELSRLANSTNFNGIGLLNGSTGSGLEFPTDTSGNAITLTLNDTRSDVLFNGQPPNLSTQAGAADAANTIDTAIRNISSAQANVGSLQSRVNSASNAIGSALINQQSAASALLDTDIAAESTNFAQGLLQQQASISVRAQTNRLSQGLLRLVQ